MAEYIERETALSGYQTVCNGVECSRCPIRDYGHCKFEAYLRSIPAADVRPVVRGRWIKMDMHKGMEQYKCSTCRSECYVPECMGEPMYAYCPNCGARMEES